MYTGSSLFTNKNELQKRVVNKPHSKRYISYCLRMKGFQGRDIAVHTCLFPFCRRYQMRTNTKGFNFDKQDYSYNT